MLLKINNVGKGKTVKKTGTNPTTSELTTTTYDFFEFTTKMQAIK
jgi:hypothetical protein